LTKEPNSSTTCSTELLSLNLKPDITKLLINSRTLKEARLDFSNHLLPI
jgi:hypothetical protein